MPFVVISELGVDCCSSGISGGILVWLNEGRSQCDKVFKFLKGVLLVLGPLPSFSLLHELMKGFGNVRKVLEKALVEVDKAHKLLDFSHISGCQPFSDACDLD